MPLRRPWTAPLNALPAFIVAAGLALSAFSALQVKQRADEAAQDAFDRLTHKLGADVVRRFTQPLHGLRGLQGTYAASGTLGREAFHAHVAALDLPAQFPGVRGFGFIQRVAAAELQPFVQAVRADGAPDFAIRTLADPGPADRYPVRFIEPLQSNAPALGLDVGSEATRRAAVERAIDTGLPTLTPPIVLVQDGRRSPGFGLFLPTYQRGARPATPAQRRESLLGVLFAPIVASELLDGVRLGAAAQLEFRLDDLASGATVYASGPSPGAAGADFGANEVLDIAGGRFALSARSTPAFDAGVDRAAPWWALAGGLALTAWLAYLAHLQRAGRQRAEALALGLTAELEHLAMVARRTSNAVVITDVARRITWVNEGFERITGIGLDEARGRAPGELLQCDDTDPATVAQMKAALDARQAFHGVVLNQARDGRRYWLELEIQPLLDAAGALTGFMAIETDVTERRRAEAALAAAQRETQALLDTIRTHSIVSMADRDGRITEVNDAFCDISQYRREELLGRDHRIVGSGLHPPEFWAEMWRTLLAGKPWRGEVCNRAKDGSLYWVESIVAPFVGLDGQVEKYVSVRTDITASKRAAQDLARERERLALIIDGTGAGTWEVDLQTGEDQINEAYAAMLGHTAASLSERIAGNFLQLVHADDRERVGAVRQAHLDGLSEEYEVEFRMQHRQGHWVWVHSRGRVGLRDARGRALQMAGLHLDVTANKRSEQALRASQALLDSTGRIASVGGWMLDLADQALTWTEQTRRIHELPPGHRPTLDEAIGFYAPQARDRLRQLVRGAVEDGTPWDEELPMVTAGGRPIWVRTMGEVERDAGRAVRLVGAIQDVTERRALAEELRRSGEVMTGIVENLPCGVSVFNEGLELVASNRKCRELLGFPDALFEGRTPRYEEFIRLNAERGEYGACDVDEIVARAVERVRTLRSQPHRFERVRPNGTPIEVQGVPMPGGGFVTTYTDISERKRAEQEVQRSAALLRGAIEAIDEAFVLYDPDDRLVLCNDRYKQIYANVADLIVPGVRFEDLVRAGAARGDYLEAVGREEDWVRDRVAMHRRADSTIVQRLAGGKTLRIIERRLPDGHIVGFRIDVTELAAATEAAEQASKAKSQFLANMSHEIRTPMNAILGMLKLLGRSGLDSRQADYAAKTEGAARSLLGLLNDILDFSKAEAGKMGLDPQPFQVAPWLETLSVILRANAEGQGIALRFELDPALPAALRGDSMRLQQVLLNLGGNAIKFTEQGEVVVSLTVTARDAASARILVAVRDTGIGIAPENHARVFSGFTQAEASTTRRFGGTGLGVAICQRLVALMGGELRLESALGQGSRFWFEVTLPLADEADCTPPPEVTVAPGAGRLAGLRLLLAEDNANNQQVARELLEDEGAEVQIVDDGAQAVAAVADAPRPFDAVLMDLQMPVMDGYTATSRIRRDLGRLQLPIVAMTANAMASDREACLAAGMNEHVGKPFDLHQLVLVLRRLTRRDGAAVPADPVGSARPQAGSLSPIVEAAAAQAGVDLPAALQRMGGRVGTYRRLLDGFVRDLGTLGPELDRLCTQGQWAEARRQAHTVKGLAGTLGVAALASRAAAAQTALAGADPELARSASRALGEAAAPAAAALVALCAALGDAALPQLPTTAGVEPLADTLRRLQTLLADADMDAVATLEQLRRDHAGALGGRLEPLEDAVARLDFDQALRQCRALLEAARA